jgi:hypothetical protein
LLRLKLMRMKPPRPPQLPSLSVPAPLAPRLVALKPPALRPPASPVPARVSPVPVATPAQPSLDLRPNPYVDFVRRYTAEGGVEFTYKDLDERWRWIILRWSLWLAATALTCWFAFNVSPLHSPWLNVPALIGMAWVYWLIVAKPVEILRTIEVRPDCLIFNGEDTFFRDRFDLGWPSFVADGLGNLVLSGAYGTRAVEYALIRRFDEHDRAPEVLAAHVQAAMQQLWSGPGGR